MKQRESKSGTVLSAFSTTDFNWSRLFKLLTLVVPFTPPPFSAVTKYRPVEPITYTTPSSITAQTSFSSFIFRSTRFYIYKLERRLVPPSSCVLGFRSLRMWGGESTPHVALCCSRGERTCTEVKVHAVRYRTCR
jgi:hypothetical protein